MNNEKIQELKKCLLKSLQLIQEIEKEEIEEIAQKKLEPVQESILLARKATTKNSYVPDSLKTKIKKKKK